MAHVCGVNIPSTGNGNNTSRHRGRRREEEEDEDTKKKKREKKKTYMGKSPEVVWALHLHIIICSVHVSCG
jgi:hypothetical protein